MLFMGGLEKYMWAHMCDYKMHTDRQITKVSNISLGLANCVNQYPLLLT